jgi:hypothetical protein
MAWRESPAPWESENPRHGNPPRESTSGAFGITVLYPAKGGEAFNYDYYFNNQQSS